MMTKIKPRILIDVCMTVLLLFLMMYQITGQELHEWFGMGMLVLFLLHNWLNRKWYGNLLKGKYSKFRFFQTFVNIGILASMICLGYSGIIMSRYALRAFQINGPMATARLIHMSASYWGFVLMSIHLGMHWGQILNTMKKAYKNKIILWALRMMSVAIAGYGLWCFAQNEILAYMFLQRQFVFFDFEKSIMQVISEYMGMMGFWIFVGYYVRRRFI